MIKYLFFILGSVVVENTAFFTTNTALELTAKNNPVLMRLLQTVDAATTDERLLDVSLQLLKSLCLCMRETLKTKQLESSLFSGDTNSLQAEDDTKDRSKKVIELYQNIYNKTCYDLKNEVASKVNKSANISSDEEKDFMLRSDCGKTPIHDGPHIHEAQNQVPGTNKDDPRLEDILYQTFIKTRNYHRFRARKYSLYKATGKQIRVPAKHNIIVILTLYPSNDSSSSITNCTKLTDQLNSTLLTYSPIDIDIIDARFGQKENVSEESLMPKEATDCTLKSIYTFLLQSEINNKTKVFKLMRRSNTIKVYIDVTSGPNHSDYTKICCSNRTDVSLCKIEFSNESFDSKEITTYPSTVDKSHNFKETISKIKSLVKLYDKKLKKKRLRRLTTQPSANQNMLKNHSMTEDNTNVVKFTKKKTMKISKNPLKSVSTSTFLINDAGSKELWMNSIADDESSHEKYKIHNTDISLPILLVHKTTVPLEILTEKDNHVKKEEVTTLNSKSFASYFILPNEASAKPLLSTEPLNIQDNQNNNVEQSLSETSRYGLQMTGASDFTHSKIGPTASYNTTASRIIYNDLRQITPNKHKSENVNVSYGNKDIITTIVDLPLENTLEIVVTANDKQKRLTFDDFFAEPNLKEMNHNPKKANEVTINNEEKNVKTSNDPFSKSPFFSICISLSKKTQHTEFPSEKSANNIKLSTDDTIAHEKVSQITYSNTSFDVNNLTELQITPSISNADAQQDNIIEVSTSVTEPSGINRTVNIVPTEKSNINNRPPSTSSKDSSTDNNINQLKTKSSFAIHNETATLKSHDMIFHSIYDTQDGNRFTNHSASFKSIKKAKNDLNDTVKTTKSAKKDPYTVKETTNYGHTSTVDTAYIDTIGKYTTTYSNRTETEDNFTIINQSTEIFPYRLEEINENYKNSSEGTEATLPKNKTNHLIDMLNVSRIMLDQQQNMIYSDAENKKKNSEALNSATKATKGVSYIYVTDSKNSLTDLGDDKYKETEKLNSITGIDAHKMTENGQTPTHNLRISLNQSKTTDEMKIINRNLDRKYPSKGCSETESYTIITFSQNNTKLDKSKKEKLAKLNESNFNTFNVTNNDVTDTVDLNTARSYKDMAVKDISITNKYIESRFEPEITKQLSISTLSSKAIDVSDTSERPEYINQSSISNFKKMEESNVTTTDDTLPKFEYSKLSGVGDYVTFPDFFENIIKKDENRKDKRKGKLIKKKVKKNYYEPANHYNISEISPEKTGIKSESEIDGSPSISNTLSEIKTTIINNSCPNITSELQPELLKLNDARMMKELLQDDDIAKDSSYILTINTKMSVARNQEKQLNKIKFSPSSGLTQNVSQDATTYSLNHIEYKTDKTLVPSSSTLEILELFNTTKELAGISVPTDANFKVTGVKTDSENEIESSALPECPLTKIKSTIMDVFDVNYSNHGDLKDFLYATKPYVQNQTKNITTTIQRILVNDDLSKPIRNNDKDPITKNPPNIFDAKTNDLNSSLIDEFSINPQVNEIFENIPYTTNRYSNSQGGGQNISHRDDNFSMSKSTQDGMLMSTVVNTVTDSKTGVKKRTEVFDIISSYTSKSISHEHEKKSHIINPTLTPDIFITNTKVKSKMPVTTDSHMPETLNSAVDDVFNVQSNKRVVSKEISESTMSYLINKIGNTAVFRNNIFTSNKDKIPTTNVDQTSYGTQIDTLKYPLTDAIDINSQMYERFDNVSHTYPNNQSENNAVTSMKTDFDIFKPVTNVMPMIIVPTVNDLKTNAQNHHESENTVDTINFTVVNIFNTTLNNIDLSKEILDSKLPYLKNQEEETSTVILKDTIDFTKKDTLSTISDAHGSVDPEVNAVKHPHSDAININSQVYEIVHTTNQDPSNQNADNNDTSIKTNHYILKAGKDEIPMIEASTVTDSQLEAQNHHKLESTLNKINPTFVNVFNTSFNNIDLSEEILDSTVPYLYNRNEETSTVVLEDSIDFTKKDTITTIIDAQGSVDPEVDAVKYGHSAAIDINSQMNEIFDNTSHTTNQDSSNQKADQGDTFFKKNHSIIKPSIDEISIVVASTVNDSKTEALNHHESESILDTIHSTFVNVFNTSFNNIDLSKEILDSTRPYLYDQNEETSTIVLKDNIDFTNNDTITTVSDAQDSIDLKVDAVKYAHSDAIGVNSQVYEIFGSTSPTPNQDPSNQNADKTDTFIRTNHNILKPSIDEIPIIVAPKVNDSKTEGLNHHESESILYTINSTYVNVLDSSLNNIDQSKEILDSTILHLYNQNEESSTVVLKDNINITKKDTVTTISDARDSIDPVSDAFKYTHSDDIDISSQVYKVHTTNQDPENQHANKTVESDFDILETNNNMIPIILVPTGHSSKTKVQNQVDILDSSLVTKLNPHGSVANNTEDVYIHLITDQINRDTRNENQTNLIQESTLDTTSSAFINNEIFGNLFYTTNNYPNIQSEDNTFKLNEKDFNVFNTNKEENLMATRPTFDDFKTETLNNSEVFHISSSYTTKSYPHSKQENKTDDIHILLTSDRIHVSPESTIDTNNSAFIGEFSTHYKNLNVAKKISDNTIRFSTAAFKYITSNKDRTPINTTKYLLTDAIDEHSQAYEISDKISHTTNQYSSSQSEDKVISYVESNSNNFSVKMSVPPETTQDAVNFGLDIVLDTNDNNLHKSKDTLHMIPPYENTSIYLFKLDNLNSSTANNSWKPIENVTKSVFDSNIDTNTNKYSNGQVENKTQDINRLLTTTFDIPISNSRVQTETDVVMSSAMVRNDLNMNKNKIIKSYFNDQSQGTTEDLFRDYTNNISQTDDKHVISIAKSGTGPRLNAIKTFVYNVFNNTSHLYDLTKNISYSAKPYFNTNNMASSNTVDYLKVSELNSINTESSNTDETMFVHNDLSISSMIGKTNKINKKENQLNIPLIKTLGPFESIFTDVLESVSQSTTLFEDSYNETTATVFLDDSYVNSFKPLRNPATVAEIVNHSKVNASNTGLTEVFDVQSEVHDLPDKIFFKTETFAKSQSYPKTDKAYDPYRSDGLKSQEFNNIKNEIFNMAAPLPDLLLPSMLSKIKNIFRNEHKLNVSSEKMLKTTPTSTFEMLTTLKPLHNQNENTATVPYGNNDLYVFETNTDWTPNINGTQTVSDSMIENLKHLHTNVFDTTASYTTETYLPSQSENKTDDILFTIAQLNVSKPNKFYMQSFGIIQSNIESEISNAITITPESINNTIKPYSLFNNFTDPSTHYLQDKNEGTAVIEPTKNSYNVPSINSDVTFTTNIVEPNNLSILGALKYSHTDDIVDKNLPSKVLVTTNSYTSTYISTNNDISTFTSPPISLVTSRSTYVSKTFNKSVDSDAVGPITELDLISKSSSENLVPMYTKVSYDISSQPHEFTQNMSHVTKRYLENIDQDIPYDIKVPVTYDSSIAEAYHTSRISNKTSSSKSAVSNVTLQNLIGFTSNMTDEMQVATYKISNESLDLTSLIDYTQDIPPSKDSLLPSIIKPFRNLPPSYNNKFNTWPAKIFTEKSDIKLYSYGINKNSIDSKQEVAANRTGPDINSLVFRQYSSMTPITTSFPDTRNIKYDSELNHLTINDITPKPLFKEYSSDITLYDTNPYSTNAIQHHNDVMKIEAKVTKPPSMIASIPPTYDFLIISNMADDTNDMIKNDDYLNTLETITKKIFTGGFSEHISSHTGTPPFFSDQEKSLNLSREHKVSKTDIPLEVLNTNNIITHVPKITHNYKDTIEYVIYDIPFTIKNNKQETGNNNGSYISSKNTGRIRDISDQNTPILVTPNIQFISNLMKTGVFGGEQEKLDDTENRGTNPIEHYIDIKQTAPSIAKSQQIFADIIQRNNSLVVPNMVNKSKETIQDDFTVDAIAVSTTESDKPLLADVSYDQTSLGTVSYNKDDILKMQTTNAIKVVSNMLKKVMVKNDMNMNILPTKSNDTYNSLISDNYFNLSRSTISFSPNQQKDNINYLKDELNLSSGLKEPSEVSARSTQFKKLVTRFTLPNPRPSAENINEDRMTKIATEKIVTLTTKALDVNRTKLFSSDNNILDTIKTQSAKKTEQYNPIKLDIKYKNGVTSSDNNNMLSNYLTEAHTYNAKHLKAGSKTRHKAYLVTGSSKEISNVNLNYENHTKANVLFNQNLLQEYFVDSGITKTNIDLDSGNEIELDDIIINTKPLNITVFKNKTATDSVTNTQYMDQVNFLESAITTSANKFTNTLTQKPWEPSPTIENMQDKTNQILNTMNFKNSSQFFDPYTMNKMLPPSVTMPTNEMESKTMALNLIKDQPSSRKTTYETNNILLSLNVEPLNSKEQSVKKNTKPISVIGKPVDDETGYNAPILALNMTEFTKPLHFESPKIETLTEIIYAHQIDNKINDTIKTFPSISWLPNNFTLAIDDGFTTNIKHNLFKTKIAHSRIGNDLTTSIEPSSFRGSQQTSYTTMVQEDTTINNLNLTSPAREADSLVPKMSSVTVAKLITEEPHLVGKKLLDKNAVQLSDTIDILPLNEPVESNATNDFYIYNFDINSTTVKNTLKDINITKYGSNISPYYNTNINIDLVTARVPKITNNYIEQSDTKLNNKKFTRIPLITENIDQETRHSIIIPINIKLNINNSNNTRVRGLKNQNLTELVVPTTLKKRNKNIGHELVNSASIITNNFSIKQKNRNKDDVYTKTIFIINRSTDQSTTANPLKKVKAEESFRTYVNKNDTNIKPETGKNASFSLFNGSEKAYTTFLNRRTNPFDNTHSRRSFISKAKYLESLADGSDKKNDKKTKKNALINLNVTSKPNIKTSKSIVYNTYKALTEEELTLPPDVRKIITTYSTIYTKEMNNSNQIAKLKTSKTDTKQIKYVFQSKLSLGNNTNKIKKSKLINVMKENVSVDAFINDTLQLNRRTYLHPIEKLPIKIQKKSLKRIKIKDRKGSIMAMNTNDFLSFRRAATIREHHIKVSNIAKVPRRLILRPMFNSFEDFKKNPIVKPIIPKHIIMPDDNDFYRSSFQNHHKPIQSWKETIGDVRSQLQPQRRSGPIALAQRKDYESVIDVPYYMPTPMKSYFLRDKVESVRSYIYNEEKKPVNTRKHFRSPPRVETSGELVDAPDSQEHVYYSAGAFDVTELSTPRATRPKKTIFFLSPTIPYNRYF